MLAGPHATALAKIKDELIPQATANLAALRRPLATAIHKHEASLKKNMKSDVARAFAFFGCTITAEDARRFEAVAVAARDVRWSQLGALVARLESDRTVSFAELVSSLSADAERTIEIFARRTDALSFEDQQMIIEGDTSFRTLHYLLELIGEAMKSIAPRSMLSLRAG